MSGYDMLCAAARSGLQGFLGLPLPYRMLYASVVARAYAGDPFHPARPAYFAWLDRQDEDMHKIGILARGR